MSFEPPHFPDEFNMADYFVFSNIEAGRGGKTALLFEGRAITYAEMAGNVMRAARNLVEDGLLPEQRILVCMQDRPEFVYAWFGALKAGAVVTQINPLLPASDIEYYLNYVKPQFAFVDEQSLPEFDKALQNTRHCKNGRVIAAPSRREKNEPHKFCSASGITGTGWVSSSFITPPLNSPSSPSRVIAASPPISSGVTGMRVRP